VRTVDALPAIRSSRFDLPLTYDAGELDLAIGDVVRVPLGSRDVIAFVVSPVQERDAPASPLRSVIERLDVPRAFDEVGLQMAEFIADRYICTLGEALGAIVLGDAVPRMKDSFVVAGPAPSGQRVSSVPRRLVRLIWEELADGFGLERLLRHPDARRAGDRGTLLRYLQTLVRAGLLRRERRFADPRIGEYQVRVLELGTAKARGKKAESLVELVRAGGTLPRADALLAGFSSTVIARAVRSGALQERAVRPARQRDGGGATQALPVPTSEQAQALQWITAALDARRFDTALLHGVTGSGKTLLYVKSIEHVLAAGRRAIVLVPEISLTPQTAQRFEAAFGDRVAVMHSALSDRERFEAWQACARGEIDVVVGARSAVFAPLRDVGLLIVDESHDPSYKQESIPRYYAVTVARERMRIEEGLLILGTATPSLETYAAAKRGNIGLLELRERATAQALPDVRIVDLRKEFERGNRGIFSSALTQALGARLERREKSLLFVNRRGSGKALLCRTCGTAPQCPRCSIALAVHGSERLLRCHYCDYQTPIPKTCAACGSDAIARLGIGTERVVEEVRRLFPQARVYRMDSDTTSRVGDHARILTAFENDGDVLVGTQMVAKGLDYPTVTLAAVVAADLGFNLPDFRAAERSFALIAQVCGRSGRNRPGEAIVQTYAPDHPAVRFAAEHDFEHFAREELLERSAIGFPPARRLVYIGVIGRERVHVIAQARRYADLLRDLEFVEVLGPAPYPIVRVNDEWRYRIALKTLKPASLRAAIRERVLPEARRDRYSRVGVNVDP
jgi:primosomal protein N' (replication factor Y)